MSGATTLAEKEKVSKDWTSHAGLYADLSRWPNEVEYYIECPKCKSVHGTYKTMRDAHDQRLCDGCNIKAVNAIKKEVRQVVAEPWKKVRTLASIVRETSEMPELPVPDPNDEIFLGQDPMSEINRMLFSIWTATAVRDLAHELKVDVSDIEIQTNRGDYNEGDPNSTTYFKVEIGREEWLIFKDEDTAVSYATERVRTDLETEPGMFSQDWLVNFIDDEKLAEAIGDPNEDYGDDERNMDYEEQLEKMVDENVIESDDPVFFKANGEARVANKVRSQQLSALVEKWIEDTKPKVDPWEWLNDVYGKEDAIKQALSMVSIDYDKAAADAVNTDGWSHFISSWDRNSIDLANGAVACRIA